VRSRPCGFAFAAAGFASLALFLATVESNAYNVCREVEPQRQAWHREKLIYARRSRRLCADSTGIGLHTVVS
jgi:hypothetical protein